MGAKETWEKAMDFQRGSCWRHCLAFRATLLEKEPGLGEPGRSGDLTEGANPAGWSGGGSDQKSPSLVLQPQTDVSLWLAAGLGPGALEQDVVGKPGAREDVDLVVALSSFIPAAQGTWPAGVRSCPPGRTGWHRLPRGDPWRSTSLQEAGSALPVGSLSAGPRREHPQLLLHFALNS